MAVAVVMEFKGATTEQYDQVIEKMGFTPGGPGAPGGISHWVTPTATGLMITDVWENKEIFDEFAQDKIGPITMEIGFPDPPEMTLYEVHNYLTGGS